MEVYIKIGTHPAMKMHAVRIRKPPKVGQHFYVKPIGRRQAMQYAKPEGVYVHEIRDICGEPLYFVERM